jgi:hypothetical protein
MLLKNATLAYNTTARQLTSICAPFSKISCKRQTTPIELKNEIPHTYLKINSRRFTTPRPTSVSASVMADVCARSELLTKQSEG